MSDLGTLVKEVGLPIALVIFFVVQAYFREKKVDQLIDEQRRYINDTLVGLVKDSTRSSHETVAALQMMTTSLNEACEANRELYSRMLERPCILNPNGK